jgi:menaquinone-dependent protoporphyrinogen oxidase
MKVLVASASRHGATDELAHAIGEALAVQGITVDVRRMEDVDTVMPYNAFVLGSAVYLGSWLRVARQFVDEHAEVLALRPTWLFSSGPVGSPETAENDSFNPADLLEKTRARDHHLFGGKLDKSTLGLAERAFTGALGLPEGDHREWHAVTAWSIAIARALESLEAKAVV